MKKFLVLVVILFGATSIEINAGSVSNQAQEQIRRELRRIQNAREAQIEARIRQEERRIALVSFNTNLQNITIDNANKAIYLARIHNILEQFPDLLTNIIFTDNINGLRYTPLMLAIIQYDLELFMTLSPYSDIARPTGDFSNFLDFMVQINYLETENPHAFLTELSSLLEEYNNDGNQAYIQSLLNEENSQGNTPLIQAMLHPNEEIRHQLVITLLLLGANANTPSAHYGAPIFMAINDGYLPLITELLRHDVDLTVTNADGVTAESLIPEEVMVEIVNHINELEESGDDIESSLGLRNLNFSSSDDDVE